MEAYFHCNLQAKKSAQNTNILDDTSECMYPYEEENWQNTLQKYNTLYDE